jgi:hypothetical protein
LDATARRISQCANRERSFAISALTTNCWSSAFAFFRSAFKTFGEPAVYRREQIAGFGAPALVAAESGEARGRAQFPKLRILLSGDAQRFAKKFLGAFGMLLT